MLPMTLAYKNSDPESENMLQIPVHSLPPGKIGYRGGAQLREHLWWFSQRPVYVSPAVLCLVREALCKLCLLMKIRAYSVSIHEALCIFCPYY